MSTVSSIWPSSLRSSGVLECPWVFMACVAAASIKSWRCDCGAMITSWQFFSLGNIPQLATTHVPFFKFSCLRSIPDTSLSGLWYALILGEPAEQIAHQVNRFEVRLGILSGEDLGFRAPIEIPDHPAQHFRVGLSGDAVLRQRLPGETGDEAPPVGDHLRHARLNPGIAQGLPSQLPQRPHVPRPHVRFEILERLGPDLLERSGLRVHGPLTGEEALVDEVEHLQHEVLFAPIVVVEQALVDPGALGDLAHRDLCVAHLHERPVGRPEDLLPGGRALGGGRGRAGHAVRPLPAGGRSYVLGNGTIPARWSAAHSTSAAPTGAVRYRPQRVVRSAAIRAPRASIQPRLAPPTANISSISVQQQPRQNNPWRTPSRRASDPASRPRQCSTRNE